MDYVEDKQVRLIESLDYYVKYGKYERVNHGEISDGKKAFELREERREKELKKGKKYLDTIFKKEVKLDEDFKLTDLYNRARVRGTNSMS